MNPSGNVPYNTWNDAKCSAFLAEAGEDCCNGSVRAALTNAEAKSRGCCLSGGSSPSELPKSPGAANAPGMDNLSTVVVPELTHAIYQLISG